MSVESLRITKSPEELLKETYYEMKNSLMIVLESTMFLRLEKKRGKTAPVNDIKR